METALWPTLERHSEPQSNHSKEPKRVYGASERLPSPVRIGAAACSMLPFRTVSHCTAQHWSSIQPCPRPAPTHSFPSDPVLDYQSLTFKPELALKQQLEIRHFFIHLFVKSRFGSSFFETTTFLFVFFVSVSVSLCSFGLFSTLSVTLFRRFNQILANSPV